MPESTFNARMKEFESTLASIIENRRKAMGGYKKPTGTTSIPSGSSARDQAIAELQKRGKVVNEESIKKAMELLGGK